MHVHLQHRRITASFLSPWLWLSAVNGCEYTALWGLRKGSAQWSCQYFKQTPNGNGTRLLSPSSSGTKLSTILCSSSAKALELAPLICYFSNLVDDAWQLNRPRIAKGRGIIKRYQQKTTTKSPLPPSIRKNHFPHLCSITQFEPLESHIKIVLQYKTPVETDKVSWTGILFHAHIYFLKNKSRSWVWWHVSVIPALGKLRQKDQAVKDSLGYLASS